MIEYREYEVGKYNEYYYRNIENIIGNVLGEFQYRMMGYDLYREIRDRLSEEFRLLNIHEPYLDFWWEIIIGDENDRMMIRFEDRIMKRVDICKIVFERESCNVEVWWGEEKEGTHDEYECLLYSISH